MTTNPKSNSMTRQSANLGLIAGLQKHQATLPSFTVGGQALKPADVMAALQADNATLDAVASTRATWQAAVQTSDASLAKTRIVASGVKQTLRVMFAGQVDVLADFGLKPRKTPAPRTPAQKAASAAKAKATRAARKTMGPVQKQAVVGNVAGVTVTPLISPAATTPLRPTPCRGTPRRRPPSGTGPRRHGAPAPHVP